MRLPPAWSTAGHWVADGQDVFQTVILDVVVLREGPTGDVAGRLPLHCVFLISSDLELEAQVQMPPELTGRSGR